VSRTAGKHLRWATDRGARPEPNLRHRPRWETLDANGERARAPTPPPTKLKLYGFEQ